MTRASRTLPTKTPGPLVRIRFGGWYDGDNYKPGRAWYFVCCCGKVGIGQLLKQSALRQWEKHRESCRAEPVA